MSPLKRFKVKQMLNRQNSLKVRFNRAIMRKAAMAPIFTNFLED